VVKETLAGNNSMKMFPSANYSCSAGELFALLRFHMMKQKCVQKLLCGKILLDLQDKAACKQ
jgi:hypothetical protein